MTSAVNDLLLPTPHNRIVGDFASIAAPVLKVGRDLSMTPIPAEGFVCFVVIERYHPTAVIKCHLAQIPPIWKHQKIYPKHIKVLRQFF